MDYLKSYIWPEDGLAFAKRMSMMTPNLGSSEREINWSREAQVAYLDFEKAVRLNEAGHKHLTVRELRALADRTAPGLGGVDCVFDVCTSAGRRVSDYL